LLGPIHLRLMLTREPVDDTFIERTVDTVLHGIALSGRDGAGQRARSVEQSL
jgi:hypothetical protein